MIDWIIFGTIVIAVAIFAVFIVKKAGKNKTVEKNPCGMDYRQFLEILIVK